MEMETTQIAGIDDTIRKTSGTVAAGASLVVKEKIMTTGVQNAVTDFVVDLNGDGSAANIVSRSVARDHSRQEFISRINGNCECTGHSECIVTEDESAKQRFTRQVDAACVYTNVSTAFTDGGQFGFGAEIGISTDKLHARGPMGLAELTSYKYKVRGSGQIRA